MNRWDVIGLKVGLEIHQQLNTGRKLFCACKTHTEEEKIGEITRYLRPSSSELGEIDPAALFEWKKGKAFKYIVTRSTSCLVEADEEPPHELDREAVKIALGLSMGVNATLIDEIYVMRKIVIDGSNTSGFQRTAIISLGGYVDDDEGKISIQTIAVEEDASRKVEETEGFTTYSLDRLGVPLIEISTGPDIHSPEQAERVALRIGQMLRLTGKAKRGIGTIRQDLNVSIKGGTKVEIKGVQQLDLIPKVIELEALRQGRLLEIKELLSKRGITKEKIKESIMKDVTDLFKGTASSKVVSRELNKGGRAVALKLEGFEGILGYEVNPARRFGSEVADYVKFRAKLGGLFHSDELPNYGITASEVERIRSELGCGSGDAFVMLVGPMDKVRIGIETVIDRCILALEGVPKETRAAQEDGTTRFMRPQPGSARMYPETDIRPVRVDQQLIEDSKGFIPPPPEVKLKELRDAGLSSDLASIMLKSRRLELFEELVSRLKNISPSTIATTLEVTVKYVKSKGGDESRLTDNVLVQVLEAVNEGKITRDSIPEALILIANGTPPEEAIKRFTSDMKDDEIILTIREVIEQYGEDLKTRPDGGFSLVMGKVMAKYRGKVEGKKIAELIKNQLNRA